MTILPPLIISHLTFQFLGLLKSVYAAEKLGLLGVETTDDVLSSEEL